MLGTLPRINTKLPDFDSSITSGFDTVIENRWKSMLSFKKRSAGEMNLSSTNESVSPLKTRKLNTSIASSSVSSHSTASISTTFRFITLPRRRTSTETLIPVLSPCTYLTIALKNKKVKSRVDSFSLEQALYFEPYEESNIDIELLKALRGDDLEKLRSLMNDKEKRYDIHARNKFGENLVHMACRMALSLNVLRFLVEDAKVNMNVRDRFGRTPLHNACMSINPNFDNIAYIFNYAPKLTVFEDDKSKIPFELIPQRCFSRWTRFLSEKSHLPTLCMELSKHEGLLISQKG